MRNVLALMAAGLTAAAASPAQAQAYQLWPDIPPELGIGMPADDAVFPYRCSNRPVNNYYHGAIYGEAPAVHRGFAYRPYYRYAAYRAVPRTYVCTVRRVY